MENRPTRVVEVDTLRDLMERLRRQRRARLERYNLDSRDQGKNQRQDVIFQNEGVWECTFVGECSAVCPKHVDPAGAIQQAKLEGAVDYYKRLLTPWVARS